MNVMVPHADLPHLLIQSSRWKRSAPRTRRSTSKGNNGPLVSAHPATPGAGPSGLHPCLSRSRRSLFGLRQIQCPNREPWRKNKKANQHDHEQSYKQVACALGLLQTCDANPANNQQQQAMRYYCNNRQRLPGFRHEYPHGADEEVAVNE